MSSSKAVAAYRFTEKARLRYLEELATTGRKYYAAAMAGVCRQTVRDHVEADEAFAEAELAALEVYKETVRAEVKRRAMDGWLEPVFGKEGQHFMFLLDENGDMVMEDREEPVRDAKGKPTGEVRKVQKPKMVPAFIRKYSDRMLELEAKRVDPTYRDKSTMDLNVRGGLLVVPGTAKTEREWEQDEQG